MEDYAWRALENGFNANVKPVNPELIEALLPKNINDPEALFARSGYTLKDICDVLNVRPKEANAFLQNEVNRHRALAKAHKVSLELEPVSAGQILRGDREQLVQAVGNLLENGIKYNRPGGRVTVRAAVAGGDCRIEVEDTGIGIPAEDLARVFERFYRVDKGRSRESGGTGLGLSIVKHVAEAHGGAVEVESRPGQGTLFTLQLPLA